MIGTNEVIDAHCHIYPEKIAARATAGTDAFYGTKAACDGTTGGLDRILQNGRIDKCLVHSVATTAHQVQSINSFIAEAVKSHPDCFIGFGALHPESDDIRGDLEHLLELGLKGVKLHPDIQRFKLDDYRCLKMYELCEDRGIPMLIHTGDPRYDFSNPNRMKPILEIYPSLKIIGAHLGGWSIWEEAYEALSPFSNFYVDCSSSFYLDQGGKAKEMIERWGFDRVLFGTDYPMWDPEKELDTLLSFGFEEENLKKLLSGNAKRFLSLEEI